VLGCCEPTITHLARVDAVTPADVQRVARQYLDPKRLTQTILRP
jgi:predicted Zn-dependent peptidase